MDHFQHQKQAQSYSRGHKILSQQPIYYLGLGCFVER